MATATLLTPAQLNEHLETDLEDEALQRILDSEETEIVRRYGAHLTASDLIEGGTAWLRLSRLVDSITTVTETVSDTDTVLAADDYLLWPDDTLQRLSGGTNSRTTWGERVAVVYVPVDDTDQRTLILVQLCKLAIEYRGLARENSGDYSMSAYDYQVEREHLLEALCPWGPVAV